MNRKKRRSKVKTKKNRGTTSPPQMSNKLISMLEQAIGHQNRGQLPEAASLYGKVLLLDPKNVFANHLLGVIHLHTGETQSALKLIETATKGNPANPEILNNLGCAERDIGKLDDSEKSFRKSIKLKPTFAVAYNNLGLTLDKLMRGGEAIETYRQALALAPNFPEALNNLGCALAKRGEDEEPEICFRRVLEMAPDNVDALNNLGNLLMVNGRYKEAEDNYRKALSHTPNNAEVHNNLGIALHYLERIEEAEPCFRRALAIKPGYVDALAKLASMQKDAGHANDAIKTYDQAIAVQPDHIGLKINKALVLPIIPASLEEISHYRTSMLEQLESIQNSEGTLSDPIKEAGVTGFYLAYHNENDVEIVKKLAHTYLEKCPSLSSTPANVDQCSREAKTKYRIGFLSYHFYDHTIGKLYRGFIEHLDRDRFDVILFRTSKKSDPMANAIENLADKVVYVPQNLENARHAVGGEALDLLFYPDIGMDIFTYFLAFSRLAPVQVTSWGHPVSTGIPNIDYFISSQYLETDQSADHYSETLALLGNPPTFYYRPDIPEGETSPAAHGLPDDAHIYLCPQTLFKFHPKFDAILGKILENDPLAQLLLISGRYKSKEKLLIERFRKTFPGAVDRVTFLPRMTKDDFLRVIRMSHVVLDPICFSGGNSTAETLAIGVPIVTWPDIFLRDRVTYSFFKTMGIDELVASSADEYVTLANRLAMDKDFHAEMSTLIKERAGRFFENMETVRELERFMIAAIDAERDGSGPLHTSEYVLQG